VRVPPERRTIAIVDDSESLRRALTRQLRASGYRCEAFASAEDLLYCLTALAPDGVLSDIHLDTMSGLELAVHPEVVRRKLPVMLMTGHTDPMYADAARTIATALLLKPISASELLETITGIVGPPLVEKDEGDDGL
jgi:two-component system response regulator FixJ